MLTIFLQLKIKKINILQREKKKLKSTEVIPIISYFPKNNIHLIPICLSYVRFVSKKHASKKYVWEIDRFDVLYLNIIFKSQAVIFGIFTDLILEISV